MHKQTFDFLSKYLVKKDCDRVDLDFYTMLITTASNQVTYGADDDKKKLAAWLQYALYEELPNFVTSSIYSSVVETDKANEDVEKIKKHVGVFTIFANYFARQGDISNKRFMQFSESFIQKLEEKKIVEDRMLIVDFFTDENILKTFVETLSEMEQTS